jgi:hypothetical protein
MLLLPVVKALRLEELFHLVGHRIFAAKEEQLDGRSDVAAITTCILILLTHWVIGQVWAWLVGRRGG